MNKRMKAKTVTHQSAKTDLKENKEIFEGFVALEENINRYNEGHLLLMKYAQKDEESTKGETDDKGVAFEAVKKVGTRLAQKALSWAEENKTDLIPLFDVEVSDFTSIGPLRSIGMARNIEEKIRENLEALASERITLLMVNDFATKIQALENSNPRPQMKRGHNAENTKDLNSQMKKQDKELENIKRRIVNEYSESHTSFVNKFLASCRIDDPSTRKTLVQITAKDKATGLALGGVYCDVLDMLDEEQFTDLLGEAEIKGMKPGTFKIAFTKEGYTDATVIFTIKRGEKVKVEVELVGLP